jgi:hypothetical protein
MHDPREDDFESTSSYTAHGHLICHALESTQNVPIVVYDLVLLNSLPISSYTPSDTAY